MLNAAASRASASAEMREPSTSTDSTPSSSSSAGLTVDTAVVDGRRRAARAHARVTDAHDAVRDLDQLDAARVRSQYRPELFEPR